MDNVVNVEFRTSYELRDAGEFRTHQTQAADKTPFVNL